MRIPLILSSAGTLTASAAAPFASAQLGGLQPGAVVAARVLALIDHGQVQLAIGNTIIEASALVPLTPGSTVELAVQSTGNGMTLQIVGQGAADLAGAAAALPPAGDAAITPAIVVSTGASVAASAAAAPANSATMTAPGSGAGTGAAGLATVAAPPPVPADTAAALIEAVRSAAATQNSLAPLFADLAAAAALTTLPEPVQRAALRLLLLRLPLDEALDGEDVRGAFANSGLFLEARLAEPEAAAVTAGGAANAAMPPVADLPEATSPQELAGSSAGVAAQSAPAPLGAAIAMGATADLKAALMVFRAVVAAAIAESDTPTTEGHAAFAVLPASAPPAAPPPPFRGAPTSAQPPGAPSIDESTPPGQAARILMAATDAALSRQTLLQAASLPPSGTAGARLADGGPRWNFEVPFATPQGTNVAQFEISRDGGGRFSPDEIKPVWRARFSIDIDPIGPVHAQISLSGRRAAVTLWAESADGAGRLRAGAASLAKALRAADLDAGDLVVRDGAPRLPAAMPAGHFLDRAS